MTEEIMVKDKEIVVPGETIATGISFLPGKGAYRDNDKIVAQRLGIVSIDGKVIKLIPLAGKYIPKLKDRVVGMVIDVLMTGWRLEFNSPYSAVMTLKDATSEFIPRGVDLTQYYALGDYVVCQIVNVTSQKLIDVSMKGPGLRKLRGGRIIEVNSQKVPRIIGKDGSMVSMVKQATNCDVIVGQNGWIWIDGEPENEVVAVKAIKKIEEDAHLSGLTDKMAVWLEKETGVKVNPAAAPPAEEQATEEHPHHFGGSQ
ncbi:MAG: exosome complex RNA-binding protein Rrp4 [Candidatus Woesearchaeota archaeon]|nr:exosome complex RNA-binding protein Rrp4 [Candidatus Woesearchaeota archaeon]